MQLIIQPTKPSFQLQALRRLILADLSLQAYWSRCVVIYGDVLFNANPQAMLLQHGSDSKDTDSNLYLHFLRCYFCCWARAPMSMFIAVINSHIECLWSMFISTRIYNHKHLNEDSIVVTWTTAKAGKHSCVVYYVIYRKEAGGKGSFNDRGDDVSSF